MSVLSKKKLPIISGLTILLLCEIFLLHPKWIWSILPALAGVYFYTIVRLVGWRATIWEKFFYFIPTVFLAFGAIGYIVFLSSQIYSQLLIFALFLMSTWYLHTLQVYFKDRVTENYKKFQTVAFFNGFLAFFLSLSALYGFYVHLGMRLVVLILWMIILNFIAAKYLFFIVEEKVSKYKTNLSIFFIVFLQVSLVLLFLPVHFRILGLIAAIFYYAVIGLFRHYENGSLTKGKITRYVSFGIATVLLLIITARWA